MRFYRLVWPVRFRRRRRSRFCFIEEPLKFLTAMVEPSKKVRHIAANADFIREFDDPGMRDHAAHAQRAVLPGFVTVEADEHFRNREKFFSPFRTESAF